MIASPTTPSFQRLLEGEVPEKPQILSGSPTSIPQGLNYVIEGRRWLPPTWVVEVEAGKRRATVKEHPNQLPLLDMGQDAIPPGMKAKETPAWTAMMAAVVLVVLACDGLAILRAPEDLNAKNAARGLPTLAARIGL